MVAFRFAPNATATMILLMIILSVAAEDMIFSGESLTAGQFLERGPYTLVMQSDCNLVLYVNKSRALWSSQTDRKGTACRAELQSSGNLVVFSGGGGDVLWTSNSARGPNSYRLVVQGDGNVVIYGAAVWATNTVQSRS
ncbi:mannose-specific lectin-like [Ananas comosus]|uniref:non-specific serine/threonine protein kinase n=1 Tax=Ananas comosus TaxID=4615 RepID=A0A6P5H236_ANACO|nr:mannose-specific lectin-like [Ananas comosus]